MKTIKAFQTDDGQVFNDKEEAELHQQMIDVRGIIQSHSHQTQYSATEVAQLMLKNHARFMAVFKRRKRLA